MRKKYIEKNVGASSARMEKMPHPGQQFFQYTSIRSLTIRAKQICSPEHLDNELSRLKVILLSKGYPAGIVERVIDDTLRLKPPVLSARLKPVYLRLPWLGTTSSAFKNRLETLTRKNVPWCCLFCIFTSRVMFNTNRKDVLTVQNLSNVVYFVQL